MHCSQLFSVQWRSTDPQTQEQGQDGGKNKLVHTSTPLKSTPGAGFLSPDPERSAAGIIQVTQATESHICHEGFSDLDKSWQHPDLYLPVKESLRLHRVFGVLLER